MKFIDEIAVVFAFGLVIIATACEKTSDLRQSRSKSLPTSEPTDQPTLEPIQSQSNSRTFKVNESGTVELGSSTSLTWPAGAAEEDVRVSIRHTETPEVATTDGVILGSAATETIEIEVISELTGDVLARSGLKKPLLISQKLNTEADPNLVQALVVARRENTEERYVLDSNSMSHADGSAGLFLIANSTWTFSYELNETRASATLFTVANGTGSGTTTGTSTGSATGSATGTGSGGSQPSNDLTGLPLGTLDSNWASSGVLSASVGVNGENVVAIQPSDDGSLYIMSDYNVDGSNFGVKVRKYTSQGQIDNSMASIVIPLNYSSSLFVDESGIYVGVRAYVYKYDLSGNAATSFGTGSRIDINCVSASNCAVKNMIPCSSESLCMSGQAGGVLPSEVGQFYVMMNRTTGALQGQASFYSNNIANAVDALLSLDGSAIVGLGKVDSVSTLDFLVTRYLTASPGGLDLNWGGVSHIVSHGFTNASNITPKAMAMKSNGDIFLVGKCFDSQSNAFACGLMINSSSGSLATGFGSYAELTSIPSVYGFLNVATIANDRFALQEDFSHTDIQLAFLNSDGTRWTGISSDGHVAYRPNSLWDYQLQKIVYLNGFLYAAGRAHERTDNSQQIIFALKIAVN